MRRIDVLSKAACAVAGATGLLACLQNARANEISINFYNGASATLATLTTTGAGGAIDAGAPGAAEPGSAWNNLAAALTTYTGLTDSGGTTVAGFTMSVASNNGAYVIPGAVTFSGGGTNGTAQDRQLFLSAANAFCVSAATGTVTKLENIPYSQYSVYAYVTTPVGTQATISDGTTSFRYQGQISFGAGANQMFPGYDEVTSQGGTGDYVVFSGETSPNLTLTSEAVTASGGFYIFGYQIVQTPEPASLALSSAVAGMALMRRPRRRRVMLR
jgi:hypothetical protein